MGIGSIIFEWLIASVFLVINVISDLIKKIFRIEDKNPTDQKKLEKKLLYKKIRLNKNQNNGLKSGLIGAVLEVIDKDFVFAEFYDLNGKQIESDNELVFKIKINQIKLID